MSLRHISFEVILGGAAAYASLFSLFFFFYFDQQLSVKINLLKSPGRFVTAPQSLTALGGSCCSTANPLTPLSPPGKASCSWG